MGMIPVADTELAVADTGGSKQPVIYLNGSFADQKHWKRVIESLGTEEWRHVTFDERARGRSHTSSDYSFGGAVEDIGAVMEARGIEQPILVGWSMGATLAAHWAARNPSRVRAVVCVDGALPWGLTGAEGQDRIRQLFHRLRWLFPIASRLGLAARMSASDHAEVNIELNEITAAIAPVLERIERPTVYVLGTGGNLGSGSDEMEEVRASLDPVLAISPNLTVGSKVPSNHSQLLRREYHAIAAAVRQANAEARKTTPPAMTE